jgi:hypothetical protein
MVDNVLLEKRNRYLGKLIQKTQNLTESVKLLSKIDKELYSQSGGSISYQMKRLSKPELVYKSGPDSLASLNDVVKQLQSTVQKYKEFEASLSNITKPVIFVEAPINQRAIGDIIKQIQDDIGFLDKHEIMIITKFLTDTQINKAAKEYVKRAITYNAADKTPENLKELIEAWTTLNNVSDTYISNEQNEGIKASLKDVFNLMYPNPEDNARVSPTAGSSSSAAGALQSLPPR